MKTQTRKYNQGFTIMEVVAVLTIIVIFAAVAIPTVIHFIQRAEQTARENTARSLFANAQSALSQSVLGGGAPPLPQGTVDVSRLTGLSGEEQTDNAGNIGYLFVSKDDAARESSALYQLLLPFQGDEAALSGSILLEYNFVTGNALSLFYSDEIGTLGYDIATDGAHYNVYNRGEDALKKGLVGFFGVDSTGKPAPAPDSVGEVEVRIVDYDGSAEAAAHGNDINGGDNYGLLCVECTLPEANPSAPDYTLELIQQGQTVDTLSFKLADVTPGSLSAAFTGYTNRTLSGKSRRVTRYRYDRSSDGRTVVVFVLDYAGEGFSIAENFPGVKSGYLAAQFTATVGEAASSAVTPDAVHAYFAEETEIASHVLRYDVKSVRHLSNVRLCADQSFRQTSDFDACGYDGSALAFTPIESFSGSYTGMPELEPHVIGALSVTAVNAGLFGSIEAGGAVSYVTLKDAAISGTALAGGIAAANAGEITRCSVLPGSSITASGDAARAGGVAGTVSAGAKIWTSYAGADVSVSGTNACAGGVAGASNGEVYYCEVGTALSLDNGGDAVLAGMPDYGARKSASVPDYKPAGALVENDLITIEASGTNGSAGGVAGLVEPGGKLRYCVNAARVEALGSTSSAGGLAGQINNVTDDQAGYHSYNAGSVTGSNNVGGLFGYCNAMVVGCYNTGCVNVSVIETAYRSFEEQLCVIQNTVPGAWVGGLVGWGDVSAKLDTCCNTQFVNGNGAFGVMSGTVTHCFYLKNIENQRETYLTSKTAGTSSDAGLAVLDSIALRSAPRNTELYNGRLSVGDYGRYGAGQYAYTLPIISLTDAYCTLGNNFHRTPYDKPLEEYASISLSGNGNVVHTEFYFLKGDVDVVHKNNRDEVRFSVTGTVQDAIAAASNAHTAARVESVRPAGDYAYRFSRTEIHNSTADGDRPWRYKGYRNRYYIDSFWEDTGAEQPASNGEPAHLTVDKVVRAYVCDLDAAADMNAAGALAWSDTIKKPSFSSGKISFGSAPITAMNPNYTGAEFSIAGELNVGGSAGKADITITCNGAELPALTNVQMHNLTDNYHAGTHSVSYNGQTYTFVLFGYPAGNGASSVAFRLALLGESTQGFAQGDKVRITVSIGGYTETSPEYTLLP